ncbi:major facilitator superfamily domain-containing protein [Crepidotus variabilis]|uniref:Major facilitator superfamily domain-containing protein n=1 Tax=Crepidotus variabilis TaxID=179855 RepID=A0A9P6E385_9AGAR|nr:major facilitator superfamily domain-containing protein [Crepidotus variabilis]
MSSSTPSLSDCEAKPQHTSHHSKASSFTQETESPKKAVIDERALIRKIDIRLVPWLALLYLFNFLDRGSVGNAKLYNLEADIGITDRQYLLALTAFFFPYALLEPATNVILRRLKPSKWIPITMLLWGIVMTCHGVIRNFGGLITVRVLLGATEAGLYPGIIFYLSSWYKRSELATRVAVFFSSATLAGAFSGVLATRIVKMDGVGGKAGWEWIFILEGLATVVLGFLSFWVIQDFPDTAKFLTPEERNFVIQRLQDDQKFSAAGESFSIKYVQQSLRDWKTWLAMGIHMGLDGPLYAFSLFTPTIINQGFRATEANLLSVPVYAWGCILTCIIGVLGDRIGTRSYINFALFSTGIIAYIILIVSKSAALSYFAVYLAVSAIYPIIPNSVAWVASNVEGSYKRSVTLGMAIGFGNLNGAVTANIYRAKDRPWYRLGHGLVLMYIIMGLLCSIAYAILLRRENAGRERGERDEVIEGLENKRGNAINGTYESVEAARIAKGDDWSGFRYTL